MRSVALVVFLVFTSIVLIAQHAISPPARSGDNVIIASYNIKWLGNDPHDFQKLAQVIQHFDVCGIVEVKKEEAVEDLVKKLNELTSLDWGFVYGFRTHRPNGIYHEVYAAVFRKDRVALGNGLISNIWDREELYRNDPFVVSFKSGNFDFAIFLVHTRWEDDSDGSRQKEVEGLVDQIQFFKQNLKERDIILMGDFNYWGNKQVMINMASELGFIQLDNDPKTTFKADHSDYANAYDHIYVSEIDTYEKEYLTNSANALDVTTLIYGSKTRDNMKKSKRELSDHLPVYAIFKTNGSDDD